MITISVLSKIFVDVITTPILIRNFLRKVGALKAASKVISIDIGSGARPFPFADVLLENDIDTNVNRQGRNFSCPDGMFAVIYKGSRFPFLDRSFGFSYLSHVLEHVDDPVKFSSEVSRISNQGYVEVPSIASELLFDRDDHLWLCEKDPESDVPALIMHPKVHFFFGGVLSRLKSNAIVAAVLSRVCFSDLNIFFYWKDKFYARLSESLVTPAKPLCASRLYGDGDLVVLTSNALFYCARKLKKSRLTYEGLVAKLSCLACEKGSMKINSEGFAQCKVCDHVYKKNGSVIYAYPSE